MEPHNVGSIRYIDPFVSYIETKFVLQLIFSITVGRKTNFKNRLKIIPWKNKVKNDVL